MKKLNATIERNEDAFFAHVNEIDGCVAGGKSYQEVKQNLEEILKEFIAEDESLNAKFGNNPKIEFEVNLESVFDLIPEVNISQLAKLGNINPGLLRQYVSGTKKASENQTKRVMMAIEALINKLNSIKLST